MADRLKLHDIENLRRSATAGLPAGQIDRLLVTCRQLLEEREAIIAALDALGEPFGDVRARLNELRRLVG